MIINFDDDILYFEVGLGVQSIRCTMYLKSRRLENSEYRFGGDIDEENSFLKTLNLQ